MKLAAKMTGLSQAIDAADIIARMGAMKAMTKGRDRLKERLRDQIVAAGFSERLAKTWQGTVYPKSGNSLNPAAYVWSKAPGIIDAYARGVTIVAKAGRRFLAIPTDATPRKRQGAALTPLEVERRYGKRLRFIPAKSSEGAKINGRAVGYLLLDGLVMRDRGVRHRNASSREQRLAGTGKAKHVESVVMFALVASVKVPKKLDLQGALNETGAELPQLLAEEWGR